MQGSCRQGAPAMTAHSFTTLMAFSNSTYRMLCSHPCIHPNIHSSDPRNATWIPRLQAPRHDAQQGYCQEGPPGTQRRGTCCDKQLQGAQGLPCA